MGDAALWGGSSMAVGMAANPQEAHQAGRHQVQPPAEAPQAPASQIGVPEGSIRHAELALLEARYVKPFSCPGRHDSGQKLEAQYLTRLGKTLTN